MVLTAAGAMAVAPAQAAIFWSDSDTAASQTAPAAPPKAPKPRRHAGKKVDPAAKQAAKPQGPLVIAISIRNQRLKLYDANGLYAESPVSTGMAGHSTPMGVFSVIQKQKLHHSNIYSGAPMPYMQRITWSGIAIHAGVLPGYPASHGCIRMPMAFAVKMWGWTKMGARVVIVPGELSPASFSHPLLATRKVVPQPVAADEPKTDAPSAAKSDQASDSGPSTKSATAEASVELRSTVGHSQPAALDDAPATPLHEQTHTADAGVLPATKAAVTMTDAFASSDASAPSDDADRAGAKPEDTQARGDAAHPEASASDGITGTTKAEPKASDILTAAPKPDTSKNDGAGKPAIGLSTGIPDANKDQTRLPDPAKPSKPDTVAATVPKHPGQISVFVSRKDSKLYVRQNFAPLFDAPVTIAPSDHPLGTHVFTAQVDSNDANVLHWSVISLPAPARRDDDERGSHRRKVAGAAETKPIPVPDSPTEALDRLTIPADAMARITESLTTGGSIIVSDQGIAGGETGEGTDFIVSLR